ncbi:hypothetical protein HRbin27_00003 [bacterium HR27]|nr:hypothetical protein HRbin27_00003 [bacterium HR27]
MRPRHQIGVGCRAGARSGRGAIQATPEGGRFIRGEREGRAHLLGGSRWGAGERRFRWCRVGWRSRCRCCLEVVEPDIEGPPATVFAELNATDRADAQVLRELEDACAIVPDLDESRIPCDNVDLNSMPGARCHEGRCDRRLAYDVVAEAEPAIARQIDSADRSAARVPELEKIHRVRSLSSEEELETQGELADWTREIPRRVSWCSGCRQCPCGKGSGGWPIGGDDQAIHHVPSGERSGFEIFAQQRLATRRSDRLTVFRAVANSIECADAVGRFLVRGERFVDVRGNRAGNSGDHVSVTDDLVGGHGVVVRRGVPLDHDLGARDRRCLQSGRSRWRSRIVRPVTRHGGAVDRLSPEIDERDVGPGGKEFEEKCSIRCRWQVEPGCDTRIAPGEAADPMTASAGDDLVDAVGIRLPVPVERYPALVVVVVPSEDEFDAELVQQFPDRLQGWRVALRSDTEAWVVEVGDSTTIAMRLEVAEQPLVLRRTRRELAELTRGVERDDVPAASVDTVVAGW